MERTRSLARVGPERGHVGPARARAGLILLLLLNVPALGVSQSRPTAADDPLATGFQNPPSATKPWIYWYWATGNISRAGITRDLEAMARAGIGEALIGIVYLPDLTPGPVKTLSEEWWSLLEHAIREGGRLGVDIGIFNCPGWSQSGGPWVKQGQSMRYLATAELRASGPAKFEKTLPVEPFQDVAVLAFPEPRQDATSISGRAPKVKVTPAVGEALRLCDGDRETTCLFPEGAGADAVPITIDIEAAAPFTARSLVLHPARREWAAKATLLAADPGGELRQVRSFEFDRDPEGHPVEIGPMRFGPVAIAFEGVSSARFRLVLAGVRGRAEIAEIELTGAARVERFVEKQLGAMHTKPLPDWDTYRWPPQKPDDRAVERSSVVDITKNLAADGTLRWDVPPGSWIILRAGMAPTGATNMPAEPSARGYEVDKMNRAAVAAHFDAYVGELVRRMPPGDRRALKHVVADSWECGSQNWTDGFAGLFRERYGYDPVPWLPVLAGRVVASADQSDRFLWDLRRLVADRIASEYAGGLREAANRHALKLWLEPHGHWGFSADFLQYAGQADALGGEFWAEGDLGRVEVRAAASASHIHGVPVTSVEAFTGGQPFLSTPWSLKRRGDWAMTEGANHFVLHVFFHQAAEDLPGVNASFGTEFNRHNTWFASMRPWVGYLHAAGFLLRQGRHVADVAVFVGEDAPKMAGPTRPEMPPGYDFDWIDAETILNRLKVTDGRFVLPGGASYRLLVLPPLDTMRPELLRRIEGLVSAGGAILGSPPSRSPSLEGFPARDESVRALAARLWSACDGLATKYVHVGNGHVLRGWGIGEALAALWTSPDIMDVAPDVVRWTHRATDQEDIYFLSNQTDRAISIAPSFRVWGKAPEIWDPASRTITRVAAFDASGGRVRVPVELDARGSVFVVLREPAGPAPAVTEVACDGRIVQSAASRPAVTDDGGLMDAPGSFTIALWARPEAETDLPRETDAGVFTDLARNDACFPLHGGILFGGEQNACAGLSVGRNGVVVYEHASAYFAPVVVQAAALASWTHVAVVYEGGRPTLYLNGEKARRGAVSRYTVRPSLIPGIDDPSIRKLLAQARLETGQPFRGELGGVRRFPRALSESEVAAVSRIPPAVGAGAPVVSVTRDANGALVAEATASGACKIAFSDGSSRTFEAPRLPAPLALDGPWELRFPPRMDVPEQVTLERLIPWSEHANEAIQCFSGTATYAITRDLPAAFFGEGLRILLDLGGVASLAEVSVNGRDLGILWKGPFVTDVTAAARPGANAIEVRVTSTWRNRLIGAKRYPDGFPGAGPLQFKPRLTRDVSALIGDEIVPSGLIGPVRMRALSRLRLP